jgi:predicted RNase H-like nuclease
VESLRLKEEVYMNRQSTVYVGVDGCRAGWFSIGIDADGSWSFAADSSFAHLWST